VARQTYPRELIELIVVDAGKVAGLGTIMKALDVNRASAGPDLGAALL
jgi:hypothetical protein